MTDSRLLASRDMRKQVLIVSSSLSQTSPNIVQSCALWHYGIVHHCGSPGNTISPGQRLIKDASAIGSSLAFLAILVL